MKDDLKWTFFALGLALVDGLICHMMNWSLFSSSILSALSAWLITLLLGFLFFGVYFFKKRMSKKPSQSLIDSLDSTLSTIKKTPSKVFSKEMDILYKQGLRLQHKTEQLDSALTTYFGASRLSYAKFASSINGGLDAFKANTSAILACIDDFDLLGYENLFKRHLEYTKSMESYQKSFVFIKKALQNNEEILMRFDRLLEEVNTLSHPIQDCETSQALQELNTLIDQTKQYHHNS